MSKIFFLTLFLFNAVWALEYNDLVGDYKCDLNEMPSQKTMDANDVMDLDEFKNVIFRFTKESKLEIVDLLNKDHIDSVYDITRLQVRGGDLNLFLKSKLKDGRDISFLLQITKFSSHYIFKINDQQLLFLRDGKENSEIADVRYANLDKAGYLRNVKTMVWWGTGPCGLKNDKGIHGGVLVGCLYDHSPASISGLQLGDEITFIGGKAVSDWNIIRDYIKNDANPGNDFLVKIFRGGKESEFNSFMITMDIESQLRMGDAGKCKNLKENK